MQIELRNGLMSKSTRRAIDMLFNVAVQSMYLHRANVALRSGGRAVAVGLVVHANAVIVHRQSFTGGMVDDGYFHLVTNIGSQNLTGVVVVDQQHVAILKAIGAQG